MKPVPGTAGAGLALVLACASVNAIRQHLRGDADASFGYGITLGDGSVSISPGYAVGVSG